MVKLLKYSDKLKPLMTVGRNITDPTTRKTFEEMASILLDAVEDVELETPAASSSTGISYAVATATWVKAATHGSSVTCRAASDPIGTLTSDATTFTVYLPRSCSAKDPNVYSGDVLQYVEVGGVKYAVGEGYLDDVIGTIKPLYNDDVRNGWQFCDGTGSTPDLTEQFLQGAVDDTEIGDTGGNTTHTHFTGHTPVILANAALGADISVVGSSSFGCAGGPLEYDAGDPLGCEDNTQIDHLPPWTKVYWVIRVGPSGEIA